MGGRAIEKALGMSATLLLWRRVVLTFRSADYFRRILDECVSGRGGGAAVDSGKLWLRELRSGRAPSLAIICDSSWQVVDVVLVCLG